MANQFKKAADSMIDQLFALLEKPAPLGEEDVAKVTELATALYNKDVQAAITVNNISFTRYTWTPLTVAAKKGHVNAINALIAAGTNPNAKDEYGSTALMVAAELGHMDAVKALIAAGADRNARDNEYRSAQYLATPEVRSYLNCEVNTAGLAALATVLKVGAPAL